MLKIIAAACIFVFAIAQTQSCSKQGAVEPVFNINSRVELLFFFKKDASRENKDYFYENILMENSTRGYYPRDGVQAVFGIDRNGYEGFGIKFRRDSTEQQRKDVKQRLIESPLVYKVYEDVVPSEIKDLE
jgi:hypothetical protein